MCGTRKIISFRESESRVIYVGNADLLFQTGYLHFSVNFKRPKDWEYAQWTLSAHHLSRSCSSTRPPIETVSLQRFRNARRLNPLLIPFFPFPPLISVELN